MKCLYCDKDIDPKEASLEHGIPVFLGGKYVPSDFKSANVHARCNSLLGRYVDAGFARSWFVSTAIQNNAMICYDPQDEHPYAIPLQCMGMSPLTPPKMLEDEVCEAWIGPLGEQIYLIRKHDEAIYWYSGGDPVVPKQRQTSRAYFFFSIRSPAAPQITWESFRAAFEDEKTKKIMCTQVEGASVEAIGFSKPDEVDQERIAYFKEQISVFDGSLRNSLAFNVEFERRFLCKLGMALGYGLLGEPFLDSSYAKELRNGLWYRGDKLSDEMEFPLINGIPAFGYDDKRMNKLLGMKGAVVIALMPFPEGIGMCLMIGGRHFGTIKIAGTEGMSEEKIKALGIGQVLLIFRFLKKFIQVPLENYIAHKMGNGKVSSLAEIEARIERNKGYFRSL
jgi:hypothetical protein